MIICLVRRSDILHMLGLVNHLNEDSYWIIVEDLVSTDREFYRTKNILEEYECSYDVMTSRNVVKYLKNIDVDHKILRQDHWKGWGYLNNVHKYGETIYTDYVTLPYSTNTKSHTNGVKKSVYLDNCSNVFKSFKPEGIQYVNSVCFDDTRKSVLMVFHFKSDYGIQCSFLDSNLYDVIRWIEQHKHEFNIVISLHPEMYRLNKDIVSKFEEIDGTIISDENVYSLAKSCNYIISDGISILYEASLLGKGVSYLCNGNKLFSEDYEILYDNTKIYYSIHDIKDLSVEYSKEVSYFVKENSSILSQYWKTSR